MDPKNKGNIEAGHTHPHMEVSVSPDAPFYPIVFVGKDRGSVVSLIPAYYLLKTLAIGTKPCML